MSNPFTGPQFDRVVAPVPVMTRVNASPPPHTPSVDGLQPHSDPLPVETPTRAAPVTFTAPITRTPSGPRPPIQGGPGTPGYDERVAAFGREQADLVQTADRHRKNPPPPTAGSGAGTHIEHPGTTAGLQVTSAANRKAADPFDSSRLFQKLTPRGR